METLRPTDRRDDASPPTRSRARRSVLGWTGVGVAAGLLMWNIVGFVPGTGLVLRGSHVPGMITGSVGKSTETLPTAASGPSGLNCVTLALDRRDQITRALPCDNGHDPHHAEVSDREDFASLDNGFAHGIARAIEQSTTPSD